MRAMEGAAGAQTQGAASLMCWGWSVLHQGLRGVLSVTEGFNFPPPPSICIFIHLQGHWGAAVPTQPSLSLCSIYMDHRKQDHNTSSFTVILFFLIASAPAFTTLSFMASSGGNLRLLQSFIPADQTRRGPVGLQIKPQCHPVATAGNCSKHDYWNYSWGL